MIVPDSFWKRIRKIQRIHRWLYLHGFGRLIGWIIILLEHRGRRTGKIYLTPLQYENVHGIIHIGAGRGSKADWYQNILVNPDIRVFIKHRRFKGIAEPITDEEKKVEFLQERFKHHPLMMGLMMRLHKYPMHPDLKQLRDLASTLAIVALHQLDDDQRN